MMEEFPHPRVPGDEHSFADTWIPANVGNGENRTPACEDNVLGKISRRPVRKADDDSAQCPFGPCTLSSAR